MAIEDGRERFMRAVGILADEKDRIKDRLLIAYASQLSRVNAREDLPPALLDDFILIRNAVSDADMPYGEGERAARKSMQWTKSRPRKWPARFSRFSSGSTG